MTVVDRLHPFDAAPERFGWRYWHLDETGTQLLSPIHKGRLRVGQRFVEVDCPHTGSPFALSPDCACGIYYVPGAEFFSRVCIEKNLSEDDLLAVTFGVAVGDTGPDVVLPDDALRTTRYVILAIMLARRSAAAGALRERYGVNVTMRGLGRNVMHDVEQAVRAEHRDVDPAEFFEALRGEQVMPLGRHICDEMPDEFGWRIWFLGSGVPGHPTRDGDVLGTLSLEIIRGTIRCRTSAEVWADERRESPVLKRSGNRVFLVTPADRPVTYLATARYCHILEDQLEPWPRESFLGQQAVTFGVTAGRSTPIEKGDARIIGLGARHTTAYFPLAVCIPEERADLAAGIEARYGIEVRPKLSMRAMLNA